MNYELILKPSAERQVRDLPRAIQRRVLNKLTDVQRNPRLNGTTKLAGGSSTWRVRVGDYRIVYEINDDKRIIFVTIIAHRREVYRGL